MISYNSVKQLSDMAEESGKKISDLVLEDQAQQLETLSSEVFSNMQNRLKIMKESITGAFKDSARSASGLSGGAALKMRGAIDSGKCFTGKFLGETLVKALAIAETNATMGLIVAAPTAGSCGILPSVILTIMEEEHISEEAVVMSLFTAAGIGMVISNRATMSGAEGGCQAECGSASAMAAAAAVELLGGSPKMSMHACAIALKNVLGLVCDPVAGLVEVPCVKRNAGGAANALVAAQLALAGIESTIPADEVIDAMKRIGEAMPACFRETAEGGLAATPTGISISKRILGTLTKDF